jgi:ankyrin repeat protein
MNFQNRATEGTFYDADYRDGDLNSTTGLLMAVQTGVTSLVQVFISLGAYVNGDRDNNGNTALHLAVDVICTASNHARHGRYDNHEMDLPFTYYTRTTRHINMLEFLIMNGAGVKVNNAGFTPLMLACGAGRGPVHSVVGGVNVMRLAVDMLAEASGNINVVDGSGKTALHHACNHADVEAVKSLLATDHNDYIDVYKTDYRDRTPLDAACDLRSLKLNRLDMTHESMTQRVRVVEYLLDACEPMDKNNMKSFAMAIATSTHPSTYTMVGSKEREFLVLLQQTLVDILRPTY